VVPFARPRAGQVLGLPLKKENSDSASRIRGVELSSCSRTLYRSLSQLKICRSE